MFATTAYAQTAPAGPAPAGPLDSVGPLVPMAAILVLGYFFLMRPQQQRVKAHQAKVTAIKRGDTVVLSSGVTGKVIRVEDAEAVVEIAPTTQVRVVKSMIAEVRAVVAANDAKS